MPTDANKTLVALEVLASKSQADITKIVSMAAEQMRNFSMSHARVGQVDTIITITNDSELDRLVDQASTSQRS